MPVFSFSPDLRARHRFSATKHKINSEKIGRHEMCRASTESEAKTRKVCPGPGFMPCPDAAPVDQPIGRQRTTVRCPRCEMQHRATNARRSGKTSREKRRRADAVASHIETVGYWCPGVPELGREPHASRRLTADHIESVAAAMARGVPAAVAERGPLQVLCQSCNSARKAGV
jgi:hypothetical protein